LELCDLAEESGILESAVNACGAALRIVEEGGYPASEVSELSYRLGRLERQRRNFVTAEELVLRSMAFPEETGDRPATAARLVELSFSLAGQGRWSDGAEVLERALPLTDALGEKERRAAANAFRAFGLRLARMGRGGQAEQFLAQAAKLEEESPEGAG
jgi:tetratricopeptide (TPR) repeat protein